MCTSVSVYLSMSRVVAEGVHNLVNLIHLICQPHWTSLCLKNLRIHFGKSVTREVVNFFIKLKIVPSSELSPVGVTAELKIGNLLFLRLLKGVCFSIS